jgi:predicted DNA-binding protein
MTNRTVNLVVKAPLALHKEAKAAAAMRGETLSLVVRRALEEYIAAAKEEEDDVRFADAVLQRLAEGAPTFDHDDVWAELDEVEATAHEQ